MRLSRPTIRMLAEGRAVSVDEIGAASGLPVREVRSLLLQLPDVEWDTAGHVVGLGLTPRPTDHAMGFDGTTMYAWCALDTLMFGVLLERPLVIRSRVPGTGDLVRVEIDENGLIDVEPSTAVMSWVGETNADDFYTLRATFCHHIHFSPSAKSAENWLAVHPGGTILSLAQAYEASRRLVDKFFPS
jgi:alkylmercury lyase